MQQIAWSNLVALIKLATFSSRWGLMMQMHKVGREPWRAYGERNVYNLHIKCSSHTVYVTIVARHKCSISVHILHILWHIEIICPHISKPCERGNDMNTYYEIKRQHLCPYPIRSQFPASRFHIILKWLLLVFRRATSSAQSVQCYSVWSINSTWGAPRCAMYWRTFNQTLAPSSQNKDAAYGFPPGMKQLQQRHEFG